MTHPGRKGRTAACRVVNSLGEVEVVERHVHIFVRLSLASSNPPFSPSPSFFLSLSWPFLLQPLLRQSWRLEARHPGAGSLPIPHPRQLVCIIHIVDEKS